MALATVILLPLVACESDGAVAVRSETCLVRLHGKGGEGASPALDNTVAVLSPRGNAEGWGGREWRYAEAGELAAARTIITDGVDEAGCRRVVVHGFSNGASFAAALVCSGERLGGRLLGVVIDDPVTDEATTDCRRDPAVDVALYWTGALELQAPAGSECAPIDWTCAGGRVRGIDAFAADLGVDVTPSPFGEHRRYDDAPEIGRWLGAPTT